MDGYEYEQYCASYLRAHGYNQVTVTSASKDQGIDVIAFKKGIKYGIQCKYYTGPVGNKAVQEAFAGAAYYGCDRAVVMTNSVFTGAAEELANHTGVLLWDGIDSGGYTHRTIPRTNRKKEKQITDIVCKILGAIFLFSAFMTFKTIKEFPEHVIWNTFSAAVLIVFGAVLCFANRSIRILAGAAVLWVIYMIIDMLELQHSINEYLGSVLIVPAVIALRIVAIYFNNMDNTRFPNGERKKEYTHNFWKDIKINHRYTHRK